MRLTKTTQDKLTDILRAQGYTIRYERGNFRGGHCIVMHEKVIVINKFFPLESKINTLMDIIRDLEIDEEALTEVQLKIVQRLKKQ